MAQIDLRLGDCLNVLKEIPSDTIDSIVTDPPYGLAFMGKKWDYDLPSLEIWQECFRVLKPGGHLLSFGGTRTYHRMVVRIEDAGFEIRDMVNWIYGSGFPKSFDVSKAIDRAAGAERKVIGTYNARGFSDHSPTGDGRNQWAAGEVSDKAALITAPATDLARQWEGWGTALKPAHEPICVARKPLTEKSVATNVLKYGTGALNIDESRVKINPEIDDKRLGGKGTWATDKAAQNVYEGGYAGERIESSSLGRWPANVIHDGSEEVIKEFPKGRSAGLYPSESEGTGDGTTYLPTKPQGILYDDSGSAARFFKECSNDDSLDGASFIYCAKASTSERDEGLTGEAKQIVTFAMANGTSGKPSSISEGRDTKRKNIHPTVKPVALMVYLVKLVTPANGTVLDPFMGSGTTGKAAAREGFGFIGIEREPEYFEIAKARIDWEKKDKEPAKKRAAKQAAPSKSLASLVKAPTG